MDKFSVNLQNLEEQLKPQKPVFKYAEVKHRLERVAFDVVRFMDTDGIDGLWQIQQTDDGEVIVAMYDHDEQQEKTASCWDAVSDSSGKINILYKNYPVTKLSLASLGMQGEKAHKVCQTLSEKLASNNSLRSAFIANLTPQEREELFSAHPELKG